VALPVYENFGLNLSGQDYEMLKHIRVSGSVFRAAHAKKLEGMGLVRYNSFNRGGGWELTNLGKIPFGETSLMLFNQVQESIILTRHDELEETALKYHRLKHEDFNTALFDLRIYRTQLRRILLTSLYFLRVEHAAGTLYKIGVTSRPVDQRIAEIERDLIPLLGAVTIEPLGTWANRGNVELYFKHRYKGHQHSVGALTEYYAFEDVKPVLRDLRRMKPKQLTELEQEIIDGIPSKLEREIAAALEQERKRQAREQRRLAIKEGMQRVKEQGQAVGRPEGNESLDDFLQKPKTRAVAAALEQGLSLREAARSAGVAINTVRKVKAVLDQT
jgi:hypothetical protein